jgi:hypothetical protein
MGGANGKLIASTAMNLPLKTLILIQMGVVMEGVDAYAGPVVT